MINNIERIITVYDKDNKRLAVFSNQIQPQNIANSKNLMIAPTIDIVSNGESTLSFQMLVNSEKWQQIKNPENIYECNNRYYTALNENSIVYNGEVVEVTLVETWYLLKKVFLQAHNVDTEIEKLDDHTVKILPKTDKKFKLTINGTAYNDEDVKDITGKVMPRGSAGYALWGILKGTEWKLGVCDVLPEQFDASKDFGTFNVETDMKNALENIQFIQELYGGVLDWDSKNKILNLRDERKENTDFNTWKGYAIRRGKNLSEAPKISWDNNITTRLYPLGNGNLNIKKVNDNKGYIDNFSYTNKIYEAYIQNPNIYHTNDEGGQKTLKQWAERKLEELCKPRKSITYSVVDMRNVSTQFHETFDINDVVKAYYPDTETGQEIFEYLRIQHLNYNYFFPSSDSTVEVGDKIANEVELFYQIYKKSENTPDTDGNGNWSGEDIYVEIPEDWVVNQAGTTLNDYLLIQVEKHTENVDAIAGIELYVNEEIGAINNSFTLFQKQVDDKFIQTSTTITQISDELHAEITLQASYIDDLNDNVAEIRLIADENSSQIELKADLVYVNGKFQAYSADISQIKSDLIDVERAIISEAEIDRMISTALDSYFANVNYLDVNSLDANVINVSNGVITSLSCDRLYVDGERVTGGTSNHKHLVYDDFGDYFGVTGNPY